MVIVFVILIGLGMIAQIKDATMIVLVMELANKLCRSLESKEFVYVKQDMLEILALPWRAPMTAQIMVCALTEHARVIRASVEMIALSLLNRFQSDPVAVRTIAATTAHAIADSASATQDGVERTAAPTRVLADASRAARERAAA